MHTELLGSPSDFMGQVVALEQAAKREPQLEMHVTHHFSKDVYARELFIPKGAMVVGKIHKHENLNLLASGDITIATDNGPMRVTAPYIVVSPPGTKRAVLANEDCIWLTIHGTDETDLEIIEQEFTADTPAEYLAFAESLRLGGI
jgi:quercetin dioxygenase-like cupin family protein